MPFAPTSFDPPPKPGELAPPVFEIQYLLFYNYVFENPNWFANIAFLALVTIVSGFIPVVGPLLGQLVILGYSFDVVESLCRTSGRRYPDFSFDRLTDYLVRGVWPFLVSLLTGLVVLPVVGGVGLAIFAIWGGFTGGPNGPFSNVSPDPVLIGVSAALVILTVILTWIYSLVIAFPMMLRAGLSQDIGQAFKLTQVLDFPAKVWFEAILASLFIGVSGFALLIVGFLMACVGYYFAIGLISLAQAHFMYQLYQLYLSRGGEPIPLKTPPMLAAVPAGGPFGPPVAPAKFGEGPPPASPFGPPTSS